MEGHQRMVRDSGARRDVTTRRLELGTQSPAAQAEPRLVVVMGPQAGRKYAIDAGVTIGRSDRCSVAVDDAEISRHHCRIVRDGAQYVLEDLGSRNGTLVGGASIQRHVLRYGDRIQLGRRTLLLFTHHDPLKEALLQRQKMEALGQLGAGIAHDLNNLLGVLTASIQHIESLDESRSLADSEVRECHQDIATTVQSACDLTRRLLRFARRGEQSNGEPVDVGDLAAEVSQLLRRTTNQGIEVVCTSLPTMAVRGDRAELHQAVMNLCLNARDAMPRGGTLKLTVERAHPIDLPDVGLLAAGPLVCLTVSDTGVGMDEATRERVFEPFFTTKTSGGGSGLGLSTVYEIVASHGGHVEVESAVGRGSHFRVYLPAVTGAAVRKRERGSLDLPRSEPPRTGLVMLVDDQELVRKAAARLLRAAGHDVVSVGSGAEAIARYAEGPRPDVVILDLDMPAMTGDVCWKRLCMIDPTLKAFFLSGSCDDGKRQALLRDGALGFLQKPVDAEVLRRAVTDALALGTPTESG
jgi:signal transduction histidine kinase/CheY-like chemotaxis protein